MFQVWGDNICAAVAVQPPSQKAVQGPKGGCCSGDPKTQYVDRKGTFCVSIAPPAPNRVQPFPRSVIFIVDR